MSTKTDARAHVETYLAKLERAGESPPEIKEYALQLTTPEGRMNIFGEMIEYGLSVCGSPRDETAGRNFALSVMKQMHIENESAQQIALDFATAAALAAIEESGRKGAGVSTASADDFTPTAQTDPGAN